MIKSTGRSGFKGRVCKVFERSQMPLWDIQNSYRIWIFHTPPSHWVCGLCRPRISTSEHCVHLLWTSDEEGWGGVLEACVGPTVTKLCYLRSRWIREWGRWYERECVWSVCGMMLTGGTPFRCPNTHHKFHTDSSGIEPWLLYWEAVDKVPEP